ncbi:MAG: RNA polymerase sigma-54 factor [Alphaproteobacteria bacterium RIFCSPHIGHO2_12_FULL_63_12]|nr:MAG: RNA polymerase sigma-54 factor [Alphaproteobacteria bacterium RIFCSPHIGHO2_12_FULL_63_12]
MALAPRLEFRQSQQLVMTPQLQQAIKLLQLSNLELAEFVEQQLEENPFLERAAEQEGAEAPEKTAPQSDGGDDGAAAIDLDSDGAAARAAEAIDAPQDEGDSANSGGDTEYKSNEWANVGSGGGSSFEDERAFGETLTRDISLWEHLTEQLHVATRDAMTIFIGAYLIDLIDETGYLRESVAAIAERLGADEGDVEKTLKLIQTFEPSGVGARDIKECLSIQLADRDRLDPAMRAFIDNIELLAKSDLKGLIKATGADEEDIRDMIAEVRSLTPKPGYAYGGDPVQVVTPDVIVRKAQDGGWKIELNSETLPKVLVNRVYHAEISKAKCREEDVLFVSEQFANANWLVKSLDQRARTILKVASEIVRQQDSFFVHGVRHLRPLNLRAVADAISMHESTVSRVTANKYVATPRGIFELKYFFTASIASSEGGEAHSAEAVRFRIKELIDGETPDDVLSDDRIVEILRSEGIDIARRTVAKYRETMNIASSVQRRRTALRQAI